MKMKSYTRIVYLLAIAIFMGACGGSESSNESAENQENVEVDLYVINADHLLREIENREKALNEEGNGLNNHRGIRLMQAYAAYAERFGNTKAAPDYLYKAGEMAMAFELPVEAIKYFDRLYNEYSDADFEKRPYALFLKAFVTENQSLNYEEAERLYNDFIEKYPDHEMADDAEYSIKNMGKSPEELIRQFEIQDSIRAANGEETS